MKLLFDESLSPRLAIAGFWTTQPLTTSSWSRQIAISVAAEVLRRNAIRIAELPGSQDHPIILNQ
jgi:hypothetical protein